MNSYYDDVSENEFQRLANQYGADFLSVENRGYGYGNNVGITHAVSEYAFQWLVVSNPDTVIEEFSLNGFNPLEKSILAPDIRTLSGKRQNPMIAKRSKLAERLIYLGFKNESRLLLCLGVCANKIIRELFALGCHRENKTVYQPHGSFIVFSLSAIEALYPVFDEGIFLFAEEGLLAWNSAKNGVRVLYCPSIRVVHKQDGSMKFLDDINTQLKDSNIYVYEKILKGENSC
ncbi:hypothetical protein [Adlercreutzia sp. ZJ473]|uniref:hypothetical protein n=1 Tax=Adlercreutzia sp. ZJ473 TaxID=2722822 RepID=UPI0035302067